MFLLGVAFHTLLSQTGPIHGARPNASPVVPFRVLSDNSERMRQECRSLYPSSPVPPQNFVTSVGAHHYTEFCVLYSVALALLASTTHVGVLDTHHVSRSFFSRSFFFFLWNFQIFNACCVHSTAVHLVPTRLSKQGLAPNILRGMSMNVGMMACYDQAKSTMMQVCMEGERVSS